MAVGRRLWYCTDHGFCCRKLSCLLSLVVSACKSVKGKSTCGESFHNATKDSGDPSIWIFDLSHSRHAGDLPTNITRKGQAHRLRSRKFAAGVDDFRP